LDGGLGEFIEARKRPLKSFALACGVGYNVWVNTFLIRFQKYNSDKTSGPGRGFFLHRAQEFVSILVGHSGAGKTTLLKMFLGEEKPSKGKVFFESIDVSTLGKKQVNEFRRK